ncbi:hypothetical protein BH23GEM6_BH23GEM6_01640 [soil metagenome]
MNGRDYGGEGSARQGKASAQIDGAAEGLAREFSIPLELPCDDLATPAAPISLIYKWASGMVPLSLRYVPTQML